MSEAWFYREGPDAQERGPVTESDLEYLRSNGKLTVGMEIRTQHGDWQRVAIGKHRRGQRAIVPASQPKRPVQPEAPAVATVIQQLRPNIPPPNLNSHAPQDEKQHFLIPAIIGIVALIFLAVLLLAIRTTGSGLISNAGGDASRTGESPKKIDGSVRPQPKDKVSGTSAENSPLATSTPERAASNQTTPSLDNGGSGSGVEGSAQRSDIEPDDVDIAKQRSSAPKGKTYFVSSGAEFFGLRSSGRKFVFLIDGSGSMSNAPDQAARKELIASMRRMNVNMELEVIFFTDTLTPVFGGYQKLHDVEAAIEKLNATLPLRGGTPVMAGIQRAIAMKPDAIFLLTDGVFNEGNVTVAVQRINLSKIPINTVAFHSRASENVLRSLAKGTGGDYRYVASGSP
jgi:Mg-chelatase subunit ChlD